MPSVVGDLCGYVWAAAFALEASRESCGGNPSSRNLSSRNVPWQNRRTHRSFHRQSAEQTNLQGVQLTYPLSNVSFKPIRLGNSECTIAFLMYLLSQCPQSRIALLWDGSSYHHSHEVRVYLALVNQGLDEHNWKITCIRFAPNAPQQNPIEDIWLLALRLIRECYHLCKSFDVVKFLFEESNSSPNL